MSNRIINENIEIKSSILKNSINYIKYHRVTSENDVIKFKYLSKTIMFENDVYIISAFLYFYYDKPVLKNDIIIYYSNYEILYRKYIALKYILLI